MVNEHVGPVWEHESRMPGVADALSRVARSLEAEPDLEATVEAIMMSAAATVPGVEDAGVSLLEPGGRLRSLATSSQRAADVNAVEHRLGEGPCVAAVTEHHVYRTGDLGGERRWPRFGPAAAELGVVSMLGFRLFTERQTLGSLDLYSSRPEAFDEQAEHIGELFAAHAAVAVAAIQHRSQMRHALDSRDVIATAKGILMVRENKTEQEAFAMLTRASQDTNLKLRDVAAWLVNDTNRRAAGAPRPPA